MSNLIVQTRNGVIEGFVRDGHLQFLGIPYAKPPIGELRFKRAQPAEPWQGVLKAHHYGPASIQLENGVFKGDEDCLTLNIQKPLQGDKLPVMVWIHGGGYNTGSASDALYNGVAFAAQGIIFVSIQYRLNVLGFYDFSTYPDGGRFDTNCGISDQILAIQWIHENIKAFGGDPDRITIAGESAGGTSIATMLAAPAVKGLFQQAIVQSALPEAIFTHTMARENMDLFLKGMGWTAKDLPKLFDLNPFEMQKGNTYVAEHFQDKHPGNYLPSPVLDDLLPMRPIEAIKSGSAAGVKVMIGTNLHEGSMFVRNNSTVFPNSWTMIEAMFKINGVQESFPAVKAYYQARTYPTFNGVGGDLVQFATDYAFQVPAYIIAEAQKNNGDVWLYRYEYGADRVTQNGMGAGHAFELPSVFLNENFPFSQFIFEGVPADERSHVVNSIHDTWVNFIKTGEPDQGIWPKYEDPTSAICVFDKGKSIEERDASSLLSVWAGLAFYR